MTPKQISVINTADGDIRDVLFVANGNLYVSGDVTNNATNKGLDNEIPWKDIKTIGVQAYQAASYQTVAINFDSPLLHVFTAGVKYSITIKGTTYKRVFSVFAPASTDGDQLTKFTGNAFVNGTLNSVANVPLHMATAFYNLMASDPNLTVTLVGYVLTIKGLFGTDKVNNDTFTVTLPWLTAGTPVHITLVEDHADGTKITTDEVHGFDVGDYVYIYGVTWTTEPTAGDFSSNPYVVVHDLTTKTFTVNAVFDGATYGSVGHAVEMAQRVQTAYSMPYGYHDIIDYIDTGLSDATKTYTTFTITYVIPQTYGDKTVTAVIFVNDELTDIIAMLTAIKAGTILPAITITGVSKADPAVVTTDNPHGLATGDSVQFHNALVNPTLLNANVYVATVTAEDEFTIPIDSSGWTDAETSAIAYIYQPETYYNGK
jgi:hypothetical protein